MSYFTTMPLVTVIIPTSFIVYEQFIYSCKLIGCSISRARKKDSQVNLHLLVQNLPNDSENVDNNETKANLTEGCNRDVE